MKTNTKRKERDWRNTNIGWRGFFQGYATAEKDAIRRSNERVGYVVANLRSMIKRGKDGKDLLEFLDNIEV